MYAVPPSVVFACATHPVSVDLGACAAAAGGAEGGGVGCGDWDGGGCCCANTPIPPASMHAAIVVVRYRMSTPQESSFRRSDTRRSVALFLPPAGAVAN